MPYGHGGRLVYRRIGHNMDATSVAGDLFDLGDLSFAPRSTDSSKPEFLKNSGPFSLKENAPLCW